MVDIYSLLMSICPSLFFAIWNFILLAIRMSLPAFFGLLLVCYIFSSSFHFQHPCVCVCVCTVGPFFKKTKSIEGGVLNVFCTYYYIKTWHLISSSPFTVFLFLFFLPSYSYLILFWVLFLFLVPVLYFLSYCTYLKVFICMSQYFCFRYCMSPSVVASLI